MKDCNKILTVLLGVERFAIIKGITSKYKKNLITTSADWGTKKKIHKDIR